MRTRLQKQNVGGYKIFITVFCKRQTLFFVVVQTRPMVMIFIFVNHLYYVSREFLVLKVLREDMVKKGIRYYITRDISFPSILTRIVLPLAVTLLLTSVLYLLGTTFNWKWQINTIKIMFSCLQRSSSEIKLWTYVDLQKLCSEICLPLISVHLRNLTTSLPSDASAGLTTSLLCLLGYFWSGWNKRWTRFTRSKGKISTCILSEVFIGETNQRTLYYDV